MKEEKQVEKKRAKAEQKNKKKIFSLRTNLIKQLDNFKKGSKKTQKTAKKCKKATKTKLILSRKYLNCHQNRNSSAYHRQNTKNILHSFTTNKSITGPQKDQIVRLSCQKYYAICSKTAGNYFLYQSYKNK